MEQFCNVWRVGIVKSDVPKTIELLNHILADLKLGTEKWSSSGSVVSGRFWRSIYQVMSSVDLCSGESGSRLDFTHRLMQTICFSDFMIPCVELLGEASRNPITRDFLVNEMHFVPLIGERILREDTVSFAHILCLNIKLKKKSFFLPYRKFQQLVSLDCWRDSPQPTREPLTNWSSRRSSSTWSTSYSPIDVWPPLVYAFYSTFAETTGVPPIISSTRLTCPSS